MSSSELGHKICAICGQEVPLESIACSKCGKGIFEGEKREAWWSTTRRDLELAAEKKAKHKQSWWGKMFVRSNSPPRPSVCDFCGSRVSDEKAKVALIKGHDALTEFEQKTKLTHQSPASYTDPKDGEQVFFACQMCLMRYAGQCTKCGVKSSGLTPAVLRGDTTGLETEALLCQKCLARLLDSGATFAGIRR